MSTTKESVAPQAPTGSSLLRPLSSITEWWGYITTWLASMSPSGATVYETGWDAIELAEGFELSRQAPVVKRVGKIIYMRGGIKPVSGNFPDTTWVQVGTVPAEYAPTYFQRSSSVITAGGNSGYMATAHVTAAGEILVRVAPGVVADSVDLKGLSGYLLG